MLKQRVVTAVVLLALLLPTLFVADPWPFALLTLVLIGAAAWEWGRLNGLDTVPALSITAVVVGLCASAAGVAGLSVLPPGLWWIATLAWVVGGAWSISQGPAAWARSSKSMRLSVGVLLLTLAWLALAHVRVRGVNYLLSVFCLVWTADIAAYFGGRAFGRHKLAVAVSPGKSWEGVLSGMLGVLLLALLWWTVIDQRVAVDSRSLYSELVEQLGFIYAVLALMLLSGMSVLGDLVESLVKRSAGAKDSSALLPGHGGVLDRIDALLPVFPLVLALSTLRKTVG